LIHAKSGLTKHELLGSGMDALKSEQLDRVVAQAGSSVTQGTVLCKITP